MSPFHICLLIFAVGGLIWLMFGFKTEPKPMGRARFATPAEINRSHKKNLREINGIRLVPFGRKKRMWRTLWVGMPHSVKVSPRGNIAMKPAKNTFIFARTTEHLGYIGTTGAGKTRYVGNRLTEAAILSDLPIFYVDLKGAKEQYKTGKVCPSSEVAGFAIEREYEVFSIAPFFPDSDCLNILDLIKNKNDAASAGQIADAYLHNSKNEGSNDSIWSETGSKTLAGAMLAAKSLKGNNKNLAMAIALIERIARFPKALHGMDLSPYQRGQLMSLLASLESGETAASILLSAMNAVDRVYSPEITAVFCRETTIPLTLGPKQMLIFRIDDRTKNSVMPFIAASLDLLLARNIAEGGYGGFVNLDELPQFYLPTLADTLATARDRDWSFALGLQGWGILENRYQRGGVRAIRENLGTEIIMKLAAQETAKEYSEALGMEDVKTTSSTSGSNNSSTSEQQGQRALVTPQQLRGLESGTAIVLSPGIVAEIDGKKIAKTPIWHTFTVERWQQKIIDHSIQTWLQYRKGAIKRSKAKPLTAAELSEFGRIAELVLPEPKKTVSLKGKI